MVENMVGLVIDCEGVHYLDCFLEASGTLSCNYLLSGDLTLQSKVYHIQQEPGYFWQNHSLHKQHER
jgi:hypothetical protein